MYKDYFIYNFNFLPLAAGVADGPPTTAAYTTVVNRIMPDADFLALAMTYTYTDPRVYIKLREGSTGRYYTDTPAVDARILCGSVVALGPGSNALLFKRLAKPIQIPAGTLFSLDCADFSGAPNNVRVALHGVKLRPGVPFPVLMKRKYRAEFFFSMPVTVSLTASQTTQVALSGDNRSDFYIERVSAVRTGAAVVSLSLGGFDTAWNDTPVHLDNFTGNIAGHNVLQSPKVIPANTVMVMDVADLSGAANTISFLFEGTKKVF